MVSGSLLLLSSLLDPNVSFASMYYYYYTRVMKGCLARRVIAARATEGCVSGAEGAAKK